MSGKAQYIVTFLLAFTMLMSFTYASEVFKRYEISYSPSIPSNEVKLLGYKCLDTSCSQMDDSLVRFYRIGAWSDCLYRFDLGQITEQQFESCLNNYLIPKNTPVTISNQEVLVVRYSNAQVGDKYATYYFAKDYVGLVNVYTLDYCKLDYCASSTIVPLTITKKDRVDFQINNFQVENLHNESQPLFINIPISIESQICNNLRFTGIVGYLPPEDGTYIDYKIDGYAHLTIKDANNNRLFYGILPISVPVSTCSTSIAFQWTPTTTGDINIRLDAETYDSKVIQRTNSSATASTYVYDDQAACQSVITDVTITDPMGDSRIEDYENITLSFSYNHQVFLSVNDIRPSDGTATIEILQGNTIIRSYTVNLPSQNAIELKRYTHTIDPLPAGNYAVRIKSNAQNTLCNTLPNREVVITIDFAVYKSQYEVLFVVRDTTNSQPIENALVQINSNTQYTNASGMATFTLPEGTYTYAVSKNGYNPASGTIPYLNKDTVIYVSLAPTDTTITNNPPTIVSFSANITTGTSPLGVRFSYEVNDIDGDPLVCNIDFDGDGSFDRTITFCTQGNVEHIYVLPGIYNAKLRVTDDKGEYSEQIVQITVTSRTNTPPSIDSINAEPTSGYDPLDVTISWSVSDADNDPLTCYIDVNNDGLNEYTITNCNTGTQTHTYTVPGNYVLRFRVYDGTDYVERTFNIEVLEASNQPPTITRFEANTTQGYAPLWVSFICEGSDSDGYIEQYSLDVDGDNSVEYTNTNGRFVHTYTTPGIYNAVCIVRDNRGSTASQQITIEVLSSQPQILRFSASPTSGQVPLTVNFDFEVRDETELCTIRLSFGDGNTQTWDICGRGITNYANTTSYTYSASGTYVATLSVEDSEGNTNTASITINAYAPSTGGGGGGAPRSRGGGGGFVVLETLSREKIFIESVEFPSTVYVNNTYTLKVRITNNYEREIKDLELNIKLNAIEFDKKFDIKDKESKTFTFDIKIDESFSINQEYNLEVKLSKRGREIDKKVQKVKVKEKIAVIYNIELKERYNADEPITYSFCISNAAEKIVKVYIDGVLKRMHTIDKDPQCFSGEIGNTYDLGKHTFLIKNGRTEVVQEFEVERIIKIVNHNIPDKLIQNREYIIKTTVEVQIPSKVFIKLYEGNTLKDVIEAYVADREELELKYTPTTTGEKNLKIVVENGEGNKAQISKKVEVVKDGWTSYIIKYGSTTVVILSVVAFLAAILYFGL